MSQPAVRLPMAALQKAIYNLLVATVPSGTTVGEFIEEGTALPVVVIGSMETTDASVKANSMFNVTGNIRNLFRPRGPASGRDDCKLYHNRIHSAEHAESQR